MAALDGPADWQEYTQETSMHGIRFLHITSISRLRRGLWFIMNLMAIVFFGYATIDMLYEFSQKKLITKILVERATELKFPTVTICNHNMWTRRQLNKTASGPAGDVINEIFEDLYNIDRVRPPPIEKYQWDTDPHLHPIARLGHNDTEEFEKEAAHTLEETFVRCRIEGMEINCTDIMIMVPTDQGYCFQFNSDGKFLSHGPGKSGALELELDAMVHEYTMSPYSGSEGFTVSFHEQHEVPLMTELGYGVSPGIHASFALHKSETIRYPPPADWGRSDCLDTQTIPNPLHYYQNYSFSACEVECKTSYIIRKCGCHDMLQPPINGTLGCLIPEMLYCSQPALDRFVTDPEGLQSCKCKDPCVESEYSVSISSNKFPSPSFLNSIHHDKDAEYIRNNYVLMDIFYNKLSYHQILEEPAFGPIDVIANIGGTLGLCLGASILTLYELLEFVTLRLYRCVNERKKEQGKTTRIQVEPIV